MITHVDADHHAPERAGKWIGFRCLPGEIDRMMDVTALEPYAMALRAFAGGDHQAQLVVRRDDGFEALLPVSHFFRSEEAFVPLERAALARCRGRILDVGAGTGLHTLVLRARGLTVSAIDVHPAVVELMHGRGVADARCIDFFSLQDDPFDTLLLLGHGIGMVGDLPGLRRFMAHACRLVDPTGCVVLHSLDVRRTMEPRHRAYHAANRAAGRYIGQIGMQFRFLDVEGPMCDWLHVDPETLGSEAASAGWSCTVVLQDDGGDYLAELRRSEGSERTQAGTRLPA